MPFKCCAKQCILNENPMHQFPRDEEMFKAWCSALGREDLIEKGMLLVRKSYRVCDAHFHEDTKFIMNRNRTNLKANSFPTLHLLGVEHTEQRVIRQISERSLLEIESRPSVLSPGEPIRLPSQEMHHHTRIPQIISISTAPEIGFSAESHDILSPSIAEITLTTEPFISNNTSSNHEAENNDSTMGQFIEPPRRKLFRNDGDGLSKRGKSGNLMKKLRKKHPLFDSLLLQISVPLSWSRITPADSKNCVIFANFHLDKNSCLVPFKEVCVFKNGDIAYSYFGQRVKLDYDKSLTSVEALEATIEKFEVYELHQAQE